jgi:hypothetical protein
MAGPDQVAADNGHLNVQQFTIPATDDDVTSYLRSLIQERCNTIVSMGSTARAAVIAYLAGGQASAVRFIVVSQVPIGATGVLNLPVTSLTAHQVANAITTATQR